MSKLLCTFSGKTGDILWSLATVQELYRRRNNEKIDFACMPAYRSLLPLIQAQPYIDKAFVLEDWICEGSPHGDQPWLPPAIPPNNYDEVRHLTYRYHPSGETLADAIARQQCIKLRDICTPFIHVSEEYEGGVLPLKADSLCPEKLVAYAFNWMAENQKKEFLGRLQQVFAERLGNGYVGWMDLSSLDWLHSAWVMKQCNFFLGCRSANYVLAHAMNKKILCYEPAGERRPATFGFGRGTEVMPDVNDMDAFVRTAEAWL
jgi:hypothetical protein